jgi:hypothetical protein
MPDVILASDSRMGSQTSYLLYILEDLSVKKFWVLVVAVGFVFAFVGTCFAAPTSVASAGAPAMDRPVNGIMPVIPPTPPPPPPPAKVGNGDQTSGIMPVIPPTPPPPPPPAKVGNGDQTSGIMPVIPPTPPPPPPPPAK